jgi:amino acid transporter
VAVSALGNVMTVTFAQSRVNQELAKEGILPFSKFWASTYPFGSPSAGLLLHFIPSFIVIIAVPFGDAYNFILDVEGYPGSVINLFVVLGFFWLRWKKPNWRRPFRVWWPVAVFYLGVQGFLVVSPLTKPPGGKGDTSLVYWLYCVVGIAVLGGAVVWWALWFKVAPALGRYRLMPEQEALADGTRITVYNRVKVT